jgi:hypothetical protein
MMVRAMILSVVLALMLGGAVATQLQAKAEHKAWQAKADASKECSKQALYCNR